MTEVAVVIPSIREKNVQQRVGQLLAYDEVTAIYVVEDAPHPTFDLPDWSSLEHYAWDTIDSALGDKSWIIPRRTDCIRSFGFWQAWCDGHDVIISLDDDCEIGTDFFRYHLYWLDQHDSPCWTSTISGLTPRGMPYGGDSRKREVMVNHGLWSGVPDLDFAHQLIWQENSRPAHEPIDQFIPIGNYYPQSGMNVAFRREIAPAMYFMLMGQKSNGESWGYHRFGDIWCGIIAKKICDRFGWSIHSGNPVVNHQRASDVWKNLELESVTLRANEEFWRAVDDIGPLAGRTVQSCYEEIATHLSLSGGYWDKLKEAMLIWDSLFE